MRLLLLSTFALTLAACSEQKPTVRLQEYGRIDEFSLTNQASETISPSTLKGKIWVADFIFTSCGTECPFLTRQMKVIQTLTAKSDDVAFVSISVDPQTDTPERLEGYGTNYRVSFDNWHFLTGEPEEVNRVIRHEFLLPIAEGAAEKAQLNSSNFIHSNKFVVVDKEGMARFHVDGMAEDAPSKVLAAIRQIRAEG